MKIYFMRHAQSTYNAEELINVNRRKKVNLTRLGRKQASQTALKLKKIPFDIILSSQFPRAKQTAKIINKSHKTKLRIDKRINEINFGFEGKSAELYKKALKKSIPNLSFKMHGMHESFLDVKNRVSNLLKELKKEDYSYVLIVTHEAVVKMACLLLGKLSRKRALTLKVSNCDFFIFEV